MADSDSDGPPPLAGSGSDSDGPPPLVDSSEDEEARGGRPASESADSPSEESGDDQDFTSIFQMMTQRAALGSNWHRGQGNNAPLALLDHNRVDEAAQKREAERKEREAREYEQRLNQQRKDEQDARKRAQLASLSEAYRRAKSSEEAASQHKDKKECIKALEFCMDDCHNLSENALEVATQEPSISSDATYTRHLAVLLEAHCTARCAELYGESEAVDDFLAAEQIGLKARALLSSLPPQLAKGLQSRRHAIEAKTHVALGCACLGLERQDEAKDHAMKAKSCLNTVDLGPLKSLFEAKRCEQEKAGVADNTADCNWGCGHKFPSGTSKKVRHHHRTEECPRRPVKCDQCQDSGIVSEDLETHKAEVCEGRLQKCSLCQQMVRIDGLARHLEEECEERDVKCTQEHCHWVGPKSNLCFHETRCPFNKAECQICLETMYEYQMQSHMCPLVDGEDHCIGCSEPLFAKPVAMLLKLTRTRYSRACPHFNMCAPCGEKWKITCQEKKATFNDEDDGFATCPFCNEEFNAVSALPEWLVVPPQPETLEEYLAEQRAAASAPKASPAKATKPSKQRSSAKAPPPKSQPAPAPKPAPKPAPAPRQQNVSPTFSVARAQPPSRLDASTQPVFQPKARPPASPASHSTSSHTPSAASMSGTPIGGTPTGASTAAPSGTTATSGPGPKPSATAASAGPSSVASKVVAPPRLGGTMSWNSALEKRRPQAPLRTRGNPEKIKEYENFSLDPCEVHFMHDHVSETFMPFRGSNGKWIREKSILDTVREMAEQEIPEELIRIEVVWLDDDYPRWSVASSFNRRLVVFRLLAIFLPERFRRMSFTRVPISNHPWKHRDGKSYYSTQCYGIYVEIRWNRFVGKNREREGEDTKGISWPAAEKELLSIKSRKANITV